MNAYTKLRRRPRCLSNAQFPGIFAKQYNISITVSFTVWSVRIWRFSGPCFPAFGLNTERYSTSLRIQSKYGKIRTRKTPSMDTFHALPFNSYQINIQTSIEFSNILSNVTNSSKPSIVCEKGTVAFNLVSKLSSFSNHSEKTAQSSTKSISKPTLILTGDSIKIILTNHWYSLHKFYFITQNTNCFLISLFRLCICQHFLKWSEKEQLSFFLLKVYINAFHLFSLLGICKNWVTFQISNVKILVVYYILPESNIQTAQDRVITEKSKRHHYVTVRFFWPRHIFPVVFFYCAQYHIWFIQVLHIKDSEKCFLIYKDLRWNIFAKSC